MSLWQRVSMQSFVASIVLCGIIAALFAPGVMSSGAPSTTSPRSSERGAETVVIDRSAPRGTLIVGLRSDPESLDPYFVYHPSGFAVMEALYDSLVMTDADGAIVPHLAASWTVLDNTTIEFTLRDDVVFHNGEPFNAAAVKFSIERVLSPELQSGLQADFGVIDTVEIVAENRVRLHLVRPDSSIIWRLTELAMLPPDYAGTAGSAAIARHPVGTGPFRFVSMVRDSHVIVAANHDYFGSGSKAAPGVDRIVFRIIPEDTTRVAELRAGNVHLIEHVPVDMVPIVIRAGLRATPVNTGRFFVAWFVTDAGGPLADPRVRKALNYGIDTDTIIETLLQGFAEPIASPFTRGTLGFDAGVEPIPYNPAKARQLLAEAGYADGFALTIDTSSNRAVEAQLLSGLLRDIGVDSTVRPLEVSIFNTNWTTGDTGDIIVASWGATGDPQRYLDMLVKSDGFLSRYNNAQLDTVLEQSAITLEPRARAALLSDIQRILRDDPAALYLWSAADIYGVAPEVRNWRPRPTERLIVAGVTLAE